MTNFEQLQVKLQADPTFGAKLIELESAEEAQSFLKAEGMDFTVEELNSLAEAVNMYAENDGELSDEALDGVAGGIAFSTIAAVGTLIMVADSMTGDHLKNAAAKGAEIAYNGAKRAARRIFRGW